MARIVGTNGFDTLRGTDETDRIWGLAGDDVIDGGAGDDLVEAGAGNDTLRSASGYDRLDGGDGFDRLILVGTGGAVTGGAGYDALFVDASSTMEDVIFNGASGHGMIGGDPATAQHIFFRDVEWAVVTTGNGNDTVMAGAFDRLIADTGAGDDRIEGGAGADELSGGAGDDELHGEDGVDILRGGAGSDWISGGASYDTLSGDDGDDMLFGGDGLDSLMGGAGNDYLDGGADNDTLDGGAGDDVLKGGAGDDIIASSEGSDVIDGGDGNDRITHLMAYAADPGPATINGGAGDDWIRADVLDTVNGGEGNDRLLFGLGDLPGPLDFDAAQGWIPGGPTYAGIESFELQTGAYDDTLRGAEGNDRFFAWGGNDLLEGRGGDDVFYAGAGDDRLLGGAGNDWLEGYTGTDYLSGGAGADIFHWAVSYSAADSVDRIVDFDAAEGDTLSFLIDANGDLASIRNYGDFLEASRDTEAGVMVTLDGFVDAAVLIEGVSLAEISANNLFFTAIDF